MKTLQEMFGERVICSRAKVEWSPDSSPCDFVLWGYLKAKVYEHRPTTISALGQAITKRISTISPQMIERVLSKSLGTPKSTAVCMPTAFDLTAARRAGLIFPYAGRQSSAARWRTAITMAAMLPSFASEASEAS